MKSILPLLIKTHKAKTGLQNATDRQIKNVLGSISASLLANARQVIGANQKDLSKQSPDNPKNDRLLLNEQRIKNIATSILAISRLPDPSGKSLEKRTLKNGPGA